jgi:hypothetical protein
MLAKPKPHPFLWAKPHSRAAAECLSESAEFDATPLGQRVVSSTFKAHGFGDFRLHRDAAALCQWIEYTPPAQRNFCVVIFDQQPVRMYLDLDMKTTAMTDDQLLESMLTDVLDYVSEGFAAAYPAQAAAGLGVGRMWYFSASNLSKSSFHLHADPDSAHAVWASIVELRAFMQAYVFSRMEKELRDGTPRAQRLRVSANKTNDPEAKTWFIDPSVYSRTQNLKLPLCSKPGKTTMTLHRAPTGVQDTSERKQLLVGMPQVWSDSDSPMGVLLPQLNLHSSSFRAQPAARAAGAGARKAVAALSTPELSQLRAQQTAIVMQILQRAELGPAASWSAFEVNVTAHTFQGTLAKRSARCPWKEGIHNSNQLKVSIENGEIHVSCWAPTCKGQRIIDVVKPNLLEALFRVNSSGGCRVILPGVSNDLGHSLSAAAAGQMSQLDPDGDDDHGSRAVPMDMSGDAGGAATAEGTSERPREYQALNHEAAVGSRAIDVRLPGQLQHDRTALHIKQCASIQAQQTERELEEELEVEREIMSMNGSSGGSEPQGLGPDNDGRDDRGDRAIDISYNNHRSASPVPLPLDDTNLDKELSIEQSIRAEQEKESQFVNFGMPLRMEPGVKTADLRYLLPRSLKEPGAEQQMKDFMMHARLGIRSPMDTAKSSAFIMYIRWLLKQYPSFRVVLVTPRVSLAVSLKQRLTDKGIQCSSYHECSTKELQLAQVAIVQLDSLGKLQEAEPYDLVVMDESESTGYHFHAETLKRRNDVWQTLRTLVEAATQLIMLDASLGCRSQDLLQKLVPSGCTTPAFAMMLQNCHEQFSGERGQGVKIWNNTRRTDNKTYLIHATCNSFHAKMHELLEKGKKLVIVSNICRKAKELHHEIILAHPLLKLLLLTSESGQQDKLADCNVKWLQYDVVIYSPTIGAGVDFNPPTGPHFDAVLAWGGSGSNPAREFLQMVGRVRKLKDRKVHMYLSGKGPDVFTTVTRESILDEIEHSWDTANRMSQLDPAMRHLRPPAARAEPNDIGRRGAYKFHEPIYLDLYLHNRLEEARSREGRFPDFVRQAISDNLNSEEGGQMFYVDVAHLDKNAQRSIKKTRLEAAEQQMQQECELIARDTFRSVSEAAASQQRMKAQKGTEHDKRMAKKAYIQNTYNLEKVQMIADAEDRFGRRGTEQLNQQRQLGSDCSVDRAMQDEPPVVCCATETGSIEATDQPQQQQLPWHPNWMARAGVGPGSAAAAFGAPEVDEAAMSAARAGNVRMLADFIRQHGESTHQFKLFCKANGSLVKLYQLWEDKKTTNPRELPIQLPEYDDLEHSRLLKGLLRVMGFTRERPISHEPDAMASAAAIIPNHMRFWEDGGDLCCIDSVDTDIVERSYSEPDASAWLDMNAQLILARFRCKIERPYQVTDVVRTVRAALKKVGVNVMSAKRKAPCEEGPPRTVTSWTLVSPQRDSLLELAYSDSKRYRPRLDCSGWDVANSLESLQPAFRWQSLTGVNRPEHWQPSVLQMDSQSSSSDGTTEPRGAKKRKR